MERRRIRRRTTKAAVEAAVAADPSPSLPLLSLPRFPCSIPLAQTVHRASTVPAAVPAFAPPPAKPVPPPTLEVNGATVGDDIMDEEFAGR